MKVIPGAERGGVYGGQFTGHAELELLHAASADTESGIDGVNTGLVHFYDGAVTFWHSHTGGQQLFVVSGEARVGTEADGEVVLQTGSLAVCPADELHWHGATPGRDTTLFALGWGTVVWTDRSPV